MPPVVLAIDPGPVQSAWLVLGPRGGVRASAKWENERLLEAIRRREFTAELTHLVIEQIESFGMAVGAEVFETVYWSGRFAEAGQWTTVDRVTRRAVKLHLCGSARAKDPNIRQALIDRYGGSGAIGRKAEPGPLYGIAGDEWSALAVAVTFADQTGWEAAMQDPAFVASLNEGLADVAAGRVRPLTAFPGARHPKAGET